MIENREFKFSVTSASSSLGTNFHVGGGQYDLTVNNQTIKAHLPFFGRAYQVDYKATDGGFKFEEPAESYELVKNQRRKSFEINIRVKDSKDTYQIYLQAGFSGYASMQITSYNRETIFFNGTIEPLE